MQKKEKRKKEEKAKRTCLENGSGGRCEKTRIRKRMELQRKKRKSRLQNSNKDKN